MYISPKIKEKLLLAAKSALNRFCKPKSKKKQFEAPPEVRKEWENGNKTQVAAVLCDCNFDKVPWVPCFGIIAMKLLVV